MKSSAFTALACFCSLALLTMAQLAFAADAPQAFTYDIELKIPSAQRGLLQDHLDLYRWRDSERMNEDQLQRLLRVAPEQIRAFLATDGFYSPQIETGMTHKKNRWHVLLVVNPGEPVRISRIDLQVEGPFNDGSTENAAQLIRLRTGWSLPPGTAFRHADWEAAKRDALKALLIERYPAASISDSRAVVDLKTNSVELQLTLASGPAFTLGALEIQGLERYPASLIERLNPIVPGERYSQNKLLELQSRLQDSPYFSNATVSVANDPDNPSEVPVKVEIVESKSQKLGFGIGMSTDTGPRLLSDYHDLNFLDNTWELGGTLKLDQKQQSLGGKLQFPLDQHGYRDSVNAQTERTSISGEVTQKWILGAKRAFVEQNTETTWGINYFLETQRVLGSIGSQRATLSPSFSWTRRRVDHLLFPTRGYLFNFKADAAARALLSDQDFLRGYGKAVYFYPLGPDDQLILHGELGVVAANGRTRIPSDFLFRTGGDQTVRGYAYQSLGVAQGQAIVGGRYLALASAEYVHWLTDDWGAALFVDGGNAADTLASLTPVYGYGTGARWKSPVGPLNLDLAYGQHIKKLRLHFSLGFNF